MDVQISVCVPAFASFGCVDSLQGAAEDAHATGLGLERPPARAMGTCGAGPSLSKEAELHTVPLFVVPDLLHIISCEYLVFVRLLPINLYSLWRSQRSIIVIFIFSGQRWKAEPCASFDCPLTHMNSSPPPLVEMQGWQNFYPRLKIPNCHVL